MGNCNCFQIQKTQAFSNKMNDFLIEEGKNFNEGEDDICNNLNNDLNNPNNQIINNININKQQNLNNSSYNKNNDNKKNSSRGVSNPTQNNLNNKCRRDSERSSLEKEKRRKEIDTNNITNSNINNDALLDNKNKIQTGNEDAIVNKPYQKFSNNNSTGYVTSTNNNSTSNNMINIATLNYSTNNHLSSNNNHIENITYLDKNTLNSSPISNDINIKNSSDNPNNIKKNLTDILKLKKITKERSRNKYTVNISFLGDKCTGKTSIVYQYISNKFDQYYIQTIAREEFMKPVKYNGKNYSLNLIVTSGVPQYQEDYSDLYENTDYFVVCFDITNIKSFEKAKDLIKNEISHYLFLMKETFANVILIGNKVDIRDKRVSAGEINEFCKKYNIQYFECSAKTKMNIQNLFNKMLEVYDEVIN